MSGMWKSQAGKKVNVASANANDDDWETEADFVVSSKPSGVRFSA